MGDNEDQLIELATVTRSIIAIAAFVAMDVVAVDLAGAKRQLNTAFASGSGRRS